ncbi:hypothetical protein BSKO_11253 [Bryopsis sp. KO-2023]|nr:hypothetical protein BSKO_11253 [Bryopsis sp. KO-2023]
MLFLRRVSIFRSVGTIPCAAFTKSPASESNSSFIPCKQRYEAGNGRISGGGQPPPPTPVFRTKCPVSDLVTFPWLNGTSRDPLKASLLKHHARLFSDSATDGTGVRDGADGGGRRRPSLFSYDGYVDYYDNADAVIEWCHSIKDVWAFGFDAEWDKEDVHSENLSPLALLQFVYLLKGEIKVALIHLSKIKRMARPKTKEAIAGIPLALKQFLEDRGKHKAGCNLWPDVEKFQTYHAIKFRGLVDIDPGPNHRGIKKLMAMIFRVKLHRNAAISIGEWSKDLTQEQLHFASMNAYAGFLVFRTFRKIEEVRFWQELGLNPDPIVAAMLSDDSRIHQIRGW